jgi:YD repeat-containing protein
VTSRTFAETDQERFAYDGSDNVTALTQVAKASSGLTNTVVSATYEPTWNHLASITDALNHTTTFAYYASGAGASLMQKATRPSLGGVSPVYAFTYNAIGLPTQSVDPSGVTTGHGYDSYGNLTSTTEGAAGGTNPQWGTTHWGSPAQWGTVALNLTTTFTPDSWGNITATTDPLSHGSNQTYDFDRRKILSIDPDPGTGGRTATNSVYDANGRVIEVDKGTTNSSGSTFTALGAARDARRRRERRLNGLHSRAVQPLWSRIVPTIRPPDRLDPGRPARQPFGRRAAAPDVCGRDEAPSCESCWLKTIRTSRGS